MYDLSLSQGGYISTVTEDNQMYLFFFFPGRYPSLKATLSLVSLPPFKYGPGTPAHSQPLSVQQMLLTNPAIWCSVF